MTKVINQNIPGSLLDAYGEALHQAAVWIPGSTIRQVRKRVPFRLPSMQNRSVNSPSAAQRAIRSTFTQCVDCFAAQPATGGATPPALGPRGRDYWYNESFGSGLFYYNYFIQTTWPIFDAGTAPDWCKSPTGPDTYAITNPAGTPHGGETSFRILLKRKDAPYEIARTFIKTPAAGTNKTLYLKVLWAQNFNLPWRKIGAYDVDPDTWAEHTLTWNNQPAYGALIGSSFINSIAWHSIYIGAAKSVCLKYIDEEVINDPLNKFNTLFIYSRERSPASDRPYET